MGKAWEHLSREWRLVDANWTYGGQCPTTILCAINRRMSLLPGELKYCWCREHLGSWLSLERSMMKSSALFECGPSPHTSTSCPPNVIHVISVPGPFQFYAALPVPCITLNTNRRTKKRGRPGNEASQSCWLKLGCFLMSSASLIFCGQYLCSLASTMLLSKSMLWSSVIACSATADLDGCRSLQCRLCFESLVILLIRKHPNFSQDTGLAVRFEIPSCNISRYRSSGNVHV